MPRRRHAAWRIAYHIVWIPKYRRKILRGRIAETLREAIGDKTKRARRWDNSSSSNARPHTPHSLSTTKHIAK